MASNIQVVIELLLKNKKELDLVIKELKEKHGIDVDTSAADSAIKDLKNTTEKAATKNISYAQTVTAISTAYMALTQVIGQVRKAISFAIELKNFARDAEETKNKFNTVFESIQNKANETAESLALSFGMASSTAKELLGDTGDILVGFGFTEESALDLSRQVNELSVDLASFTNFEGGAAGASKALTKAILGETESAKALGLVLRQGTSEFKQQVTVLQETEKMSYNQAMATVLLRDAYKQSEKAIGDFARTQADLANQERILDEVTKNLKEEIGERLTPMFLKATTGAINFFRSLTETSLESTIRELGELGVAAEDILVLKKFNWQMQLEDINAKLKKAGINYEDIKDVNAEIKKLTEDEITLIKTKAAMLTKEQTAIGDFLDIYHDLGASQEDINRLIQNYNGYLKNSGNETDAIKDLWGLVYGEILDSTNKVREQKTDLSKYTDLLIDREKLENKINETIDKRPKATKEDIEAFREFNNAKIVLIRQAQLIGIALLEDELNEEKKYYKDLGELTAENEKDKIASYSRIVKLEKQINKEKVDLAKKAEEEKEKIREKELKEETKRQEELETLRDEFAERGDDLNLSIYERQIKAIDDFYVEKKDKLMEAGLTEQEITEQSEQAKAAIREQYERRAVSGMSQMFDNLGKVMKSQGRAGFVMWKKMAVAQALIDTYKAANASYAALAVINPILGALAAAAAIAAGLANVKQIESQKFGEGGIVEDETLATIGEKGPEAVVPLPGGRKIPVDIRGIGSDKLLNKIIDILGDIRDAQAEGILKIIIEDKSDLVGFYRYYLAAKAEYENRGL